jgi:amino acid transporter/nucleotide-binding universal stress UspA family protein
MPTSEEAGSPSGRRGLLRTAQVIVVSSITFTFISYWRTAAVVLCDMGSTAYYIGGIVEQSIGKAAPWFILAVMLFSYSVRWIYIESCTLFVRGGVYRVVREAMGRFPAKLAVSALIFDYVLTGPISSVSAGQYIIGLILETATHLGGVHIPVETRDLCKQWGSVLIACAITLYFFRLNLIGIHESSEKAMKIMIVTTIMAVIILSWSGLTLVMRDPSQINSIPLQPDLHPKVNPTTGEVEDPTGFLKHTALGEQLRTLSGEQWLSLVGVIGIFLAFGHSILAMSGEETLAQVYREVESPKLPNFKKAAFIVFAFSMIFTGGISFLAVLLIPDNVRMSHYSENLIGGLAMNVWAPAWAQPWAPLLLNAFVVVVGFLMLSGAVNTAIIGSNGVLNRVAEDGVMPSWFLRPHPKFGTTYRVLYLIVFLQLTTIIISRGNVILLGEAYAFGVVWSFVFQGLSMTILRFKDPRPREFKVPLNIPVGRYEVPVGLILILLVLLASAIMNLLTKEIATIGGLCFTAFFFALFYFSESYYERKRRGKPHEHLEQFNRAVTPEVSPERLGLEKEYRKLVAIRSPHNLYMLEKALAETDPDTTDVVVMTARELPSGSSELPKGDLDIYDQQLMTAVVDVAERAGKEVHPLIVPTNNPLHAVVRTATDLGVQELVMGTSNKHSADAQLDRIAFYWIHLHAGQTPPLTVRLLSHHRDVYLDLGGGNRIPKISERRARSVAELRAAGVGVDRVLLVHDGTVASSDLLKAVLTMLDPDVALGLIWSPTTSPSNGSTTFEQDQQQAQKLGREFEVYTAEGDWAAEVVRVAQEKDYDLIVLPFHPDREGVAPPAWEPSLGHILTHAHCRVFLSSAPAIPQEVDEEPPAAPDANVQDP